MFESQLSLQQSIVQTVKFALQEDIGSGDITAELIDENSQTQAHVISRDNAIICGTQWVDEVFNQLDSSVEIDWLVSDGDAVKANQTLVKFNGNARSLLTAERTALNFLQTLSATATVASEYAALVAESSLQILDTRKTIPNLRLAQKYAVSCGGCTNHRIGLYDAYLIKENHIAAYGSISAVIEKARELQPQKLLEIEVETEVQLIEALCSSADVIMLDNFDNTGIIRAVELRAQHCPSAKLEISGNVDKQRIIEVRDLGADYISVGALTKHCQAIDLSMQFT